MPIKLNLLLLHASSTHLFQDLCGLGCILALHSDLCAVLVEHEWKRDTGDGQEGWDRAGPVVSQVLVHLPREQWKGGAEDGSQDRVRGQDRSREDDICSN